MNTDETTALEEARADLERANLHTYGRGVVLLLEQMLQMRALYGGDGIHLSSAQVVALLHVIDSHNESHVDTAERYLACRKALEQVARLVPEGWQPRPWGYVSIDLPDALVGQIRSTLSAPEEGATR